MTGGWWWMGCVMQVIICDFIAMLSQLAGRVWWPEHLLGPCWVQRSTQPSWLGHRIFSVIVVAGLEPRQLETAGFYGAQAEALYHFACTAACEAS